MNRLSSQSIHHYRHIVKAHLPAAARGLRKLRQEWRVPLSFKVFVFLLTGGSPAVRAFHVSVPALSFRDNFKAHFGSFVLPDVTAGPQKCPNRKVWCRSNYSGCVSEKKWNSSAENIQARDTEQPQLLCFPFCLSIQERLEKWKKKATVIGAWQKIDTPVCHFFVGSFFLFYKAFLRNNLSNGSLAELHIRFNWRLY